MLDVTVGAGNAKKDTVFFIERWTKRPREDGVGDPHGSSCS